MKYFTKEWFIKDSLCSIMSRVKESEIAETKDEERYLELYRKKLSAHLAAEKQNDLYKNPKEELQRYDIYISEPQKKNVASGYNISRLLLKQIRIV